jgi:glycosyltransferase involved in cell wall biosynthesis
MGAFAWWLKQREEIPYVITEHWSRYQPQHNNFKGFFRKWLTRKVVKNASAVSPVSADLQKAMENHGLKNPNYRVIPNVVDVDFFHPDKEKKASDKTVFIHLSCMEERSKNMSGILNAVKDLASKRDDFILYMVGEGIDLEATIRRAEDLGLKDKVVFFTGLKEGEQLLKLMQRADAMLLFSRYENLPVVILEAFACGMPVISSDVGGISEHLNNERGILVKPLDEQALTGAMNKMIESKDDYNSKSIRQYAAAHFSMEVIGKQFDKIYSEAISGK